jgi:hypothetical protein
LFDRCSAYFRSLHAHDGTLVMPFDLALVRIQYLDLSHEGRQGKKH